MTKIQYTLRGIPLPLDQALRKRAQQSGKPFNQTVVESLNLQVFGTIEPHEPRLEDLFGAGADLLDDDFDQAIAEFSKADKKFWDDPDHTRY